MRIIKQRYSKRQAVLISPEKSFLLFRWTNKSSDSQSGLNTQTKQSLISISAAVQLNGIMEQLRYRRQPALNSDEVPTIFMNEQPFDVSMTKFLTENFALSGCSNGVLHIWDVVAGEVVRTLRNGPMPTPGHLLPDTIYASLGLAESTQPREEPAITSITASDSALAKRHPFNWLCSGDTSGCIVVRRYSVAQSQQTGTSTIAVRVHRKFGPPFKNFAHFQKDAVTCLCLLDISGPGEPPRVTILASGDMVGCIRLWLLPQCTQLAQLSASCEAILVDLALTQYAMTNSQTNDFERAVSERWIQVTGLVSAQALDASYERGRVVVAHVNANENCGIRNAMYSPRIRNACK
ncbi:hypothetical protein AAHC03_05500 [Spirometra sp. Aus1]